MMSDCMYIIKLNDFFKIGITSNINSRISHIQNASPYNVEIIKLYEFSSGNESRLAESMSHKKLKEMGLHEKNEWFKCDQATAISVCDESAIFSKNKNINYSKNIRDKAFNLLKIIKKEVVVDVTKINIERINFLVNSNLNMMTLDEARLINLIVEGNE